MSLRRGWEEYKAEDRVVSSLTSERKAKIWKRKVTTAKGNKEMWSVLRRLTTNRGVSTLSARSRKLTVLYDYLNVSNLKFGKHETGMKKVLRSWLSSEVVDTEVCQSFTTD